MKITDALLGEHGVFYAEFSRLEELVMLAEQAVEVRALAALLAAALVTHARLEDELLFDRLEAGLGAQAGPLPVMRAEHEQIDGALADVMKAPEIVAARQGLLDAIDVARRHFAKEEQVLFPLAERMVPAPVLHELGGRWARRRGVTLGVGA